ncbi:MAG: peptidoglycan-binding domain-containing protein [Clostridioides difficile]|nr:peptidoglycan-binding domain-containing protein [Clostridioides difficile]
MKKNFLLSMMICALSFSLTGVIANASTITSEKPTSDEISSLTTSRYSDSTILYSQSKNGSTYNKYVKNIQNDLNYYFNNYGYSSYAIQADGYYGSNTTQAVKRFQKLNNLNYQDGTFRQETATCLSNYTYNS